jgi:hypothetical protein
MSLIDVFSRHHREERTSTEEPSRGALLYSSSGAAFVGAFLGCLTSSYLSALGVAPAIASALATTFLCGQVLVIRTTSLLPDELFLAIYGGAFAGMTPLLWFSSNAPDPSFLHLSLLFISLAIASGFAFCVVAAIDTRTARPLASGYGGRCGAIAAVASFAFVELASLAGADDTLFRSARADVLDASPTALTFVACLVGTFAVLLPLRGQGMTSAKTADRIFLAAAIALTGLIGLHLSGLNDASTMDAFYAGCFLGMSTSERLKWRIEAVMAAMVLAVLLVQVRRLLPGVGGSLGLAAFLTVALVVALGQVAAFVTQGFSGRHENPEPVSQPFAADPVVVEQSLRFEPQVSSAEGTARWRARVTANAILASLAIGCVVLGGLLVPDGPLLNMVASTQVAGGAASSPEQPVLFQAIPQAADDAIPPGTPSVEVDKADLTMTRDSLAAGQDVNGQRVNGQGIDVQAQLKYRADTAISAASEAAAPPTVQPHIDGVPDGMKEPRDTIFREFLQWRAARSAGIAQPSAQPPKKKRSHFSRIAGSLAAAATTATSAPQAPPRPQAGRPHRATPPAGRSPPVRQPAPILEAQPQ